MRKYLLAIIVMVVAGVGVALYLIPDEKEVQTLRAVDAERHHVAIDAQERYDAGDRSSGVLAGVADIAIQDGRAGELIPELQVYLQTNPNDDKVRQKLAMCHRATGDARSYLTEIQKVVEQSPTEQNLQLLADAYNMNQQYEQQAETLRTLIDVSQGSEPDYYADLAIILALMDRDDEALATVQELRERHPNYTSYKLTRLVVASYVDSGQMEEAFREASSWTARQVEPQQVAELTDLLNYGGRPDLALQLSEPHRALIDEHTPLMVAYVNALILDEREDEAYDLLRLRHEEGKLPPELYRPLIELALGAGDEPYAYEVAGELQADMFTQTQAINLMELAYQEDSNRILERLIALFDVEGYRDDKPVLQAVIALHRRDSDEDLKIAAALQAEMNETERLRLAQSCARNDKEDCFNQVVARYPAYDEMTPREVDEIVMLYIAAERPEEIKDTIYELAERKQNEQINLSSMKLAAATNDGDRLADWLATSGRTAATTDLAALYFIASDHRHPSAAAPIAQMLYDRDPNKRHREYVIGSYVLAGEPAKALPLLRESMAESNAQEDNYLAALVKLSRSDAAYRDELAAHVIPQMESDEVSSERKLQLAYTLINSGQLKKAKPYINRYAKSEGGDWKVMYNQIYAVARPGKAGPTEIPITERSRDFRVAIAQDPKTTDKTKEMLAFSLLDDGYRDDATRIFFDLAQTKGPDSKQVKDLLYLWGPRLNEEQMGWLALRASASTTLGERVRWGELIAENGDDYALMNYITHHPEALAHPSLRRRYFNALSTHGNEETVVVGMRPWIDATNDMAALRDYADIATGNGYPQGALYALQKMQQLNPQDEWTLKQLAVLSYGRADYSEVGQYVDRYVEAHNQTPAPQTSPYEVLFYQASLLRRGGNLDQARPYYQQVVDLAPHVADTTTEQSIYYTSLFYLGQQDLARQGFYTLLNREPNNKGLLADFLNVLIETDHLDEAKAVANQYDTNSPHHPVAQQPYQIQAPNLTGVTPYENGREMHLQFDGRVPQSLIPQHGQPQPGWVEGMKAGHNSLVIAAKPGYRLRFTPTSTQGIAIVAMSGANMSPKERLERQQELRLQLLYARMELASGNTEQARARINAIKPHFEDDSQYLGFAANVENAAGNWPRALDLLESAQQMAPANEDIAQLRNDIGRLHGQEIKIDHTWRSIGDSNEQITTLSGRVRPTRQTELGIVLQNNEVDAENIRRSRTGNIEDFSVSRQRAELYGAYYFDNGDALKASLFANNDVPGAGAYYSFNNPIGRSEVFVEYQRPYWDFVEAVTETANRDRVGAKHVANLDERTTVSGELSLNRYNIELEDDVVNSVLVRANIVRRVRDANPTVSIGYGFDGEYLSGEDRNLDANGDPFRTFPLVDREIHYPSVIVSDDLTEDTFGEVVAGYAFDRLGEHGPQVQGRLTHDVTEDVEAEVRATYGLQTNDTDQNVTQVGGHLKYRF